MNSDYKGLLTQERHALITDEYTAIRSSEKGSMMSDHYICKKVALKFGCAPSHVYNVCRAAGITQPRAYVSRYTKFLRKTNH